MSDYIVTKDGELKHYGVPGMKWGRRKAQSKSTGSSRVGRAARALLDSTSGVMGGPKRKSGTPDGALGGPKKSPVPNDAKQGPKPNRPKNVGDNLRKKTKSGETSALSTLAKVGGMSISTAARWKQNEATINMFENMLSGNYGKAADENLRRRMYGSIAGSF